MFRKDYIQTIPRKGAMFIKGYWSFRKPIFGNKMNKLKVILKTNWSVKVPSLKNDLEYRPFLMNIGDFFDCFFIF